MTQHHLQLLPLQPPPLELPQWDAFLGNYPDESAITQLVSQRSSEPIELEGMLWRLVCAVQREVNLNPYGKDLPGRDEWVLLPSVFDTADCEDFTLTKRSLLRQSIPVGVLRPVICRARVTRQRVDTHMVLSIHTTKGDYIMDLGRRSTIRLASFFDHKWLWILDKGIWRGLMPHTEGHQQLKELRKQGLHKPRGLHDRLSRRRSPPLLS